VKKLGRRWNELKLRDESGKLRKLPGSWKSVTARRARLRRRRTANGVKREAADRLRKEQEKRNKRGW
jgi:hypothetical protein